MVKFYGKKRLKNDKLRFNIIKSKNLLADARLYKQLNLNSNSDN